MSAHGGRSRTTSAPTSRSVNGMTVTQPWSGTGRSTTRGPKSKRSQTEPRGRTLASLRPGHGNFTNPKEWDLRTNIPVTPTTKARRMVFPLSPGIREETGTVHWSSVTKVPVEVAKRSTQVQLNEVSVPFRLGDRVILIDGRTGIIRWMGCLNSRTPQQDLAVGVQLDDAAGEHDGTYRGKRYFHCQEYHGTMISGTKVAKYLPPNTVDYRSTDSDAGRFTAKAPLGPIEHRKKEKLKAQKILREQARKKLISAQSEGDRERRKKEEQRALEEAERLLAAEEAEKRIREAEEAVLAEEAALAAAEAQLEAEAEAKGLVLPPKAEREKSAREMIENPAPAPEPAKEALSAPELDPAPAPAPAPAPEETAAEEPPKQPAGTEILAAMGWLEPAAPTDGKAAETNADGADSSAEAAPAGVTEADIHAEMDSMFGEDLEPNAPAHDDGTF